MSAKDIFHNLVKNALIKEGWTITDDPLYLNFGGVDLYVNLGAEKIIAAEKNNQKMDIEIKTFNQPSLTSQFHTALGQYLNYRLILEKKEPERILYLAVPEDIYQSFFLLLFTQESLKKYQVNLIIYDIDQEVIKQWIN